YCAEIGELSSSGMMAAIMRAECSGGHTPPCVLMRRAPQDRIAGNSPEKIRMNSSHSNAASTETIWYFDVISPFSYLAMGGIEELAKRVQIVYRPVLFAALLERWKHLGPAEIPSKRIHTYRLCTFEAQRRGIVFRFPTHHPFNPLKPLRLL